jgi:ABC-2 type transport system ATP-binding protein
VLVSTHYMDEAVRCHKLAYIASGKLLTQGSAAEIVAGQKLSTWAIHGERITEIQDKLRGERGVEQTVSFGDTLHVSGSDPDVLRQAVETAVHDGGLRAEPIDTGLEDVFIHLMSRSESNSGGQA